MGVARAFEIVQGIRIYGASRGHLCDSMAFLLFFEAAPLFVKGGVCSIAQWPVQV